MIHCANEHVQTSLKLQLPFVALHPVTARPRHHSNLGRFFKKPVALFQVAREHGLERDVRCVRETHREGDVDEEEDQFSGT